MRRLKSSACVVYKRCLPRSFSSNEPCCAYTEIVQTKGWLTEFSAAVLAAVRLSGWSWRIAVARQLSRCPSLKEGLFEEHWWGFVALCNGSLSDCGLCAVWTLILRKRGVRALHSLPSTARTRLARDGDTVYFKATFAQAEALYRAPRDVINKMLPAARNAFENGTTTSSSTYDGAFKPMSIKPFTRDSAKRIFKYRSKLAARALHFRCPYLLKSTRHSSGVGRFLVKP